MVPSCRIASSCVFLFVPVGIRRFNLSMLSRWEPLVPRSSADDMVLVQQRRPYEADQFARPSDHGLRCRLAMRRQVTLAAIQPLLRLVRDGNHGRRLPRASLGEPGADAGRMTVVPRGFDEHAARMAIARLGDSPAPRAL